MPRENRLIIFDYDEVYKAIYTLCEQKEIKVPEPGKIKNASYADGDPARILLEIVDSGTNKKNREEYNRDFVAAALMLYCRGLGIPLPKTSKKAVSVTDGEVMLRVTI